jgi:hypothetical protein
MLTTAQCELINNAQHTHDYSEEAIASYEANGDDMMDALQERFEGIIEHDKADDVGGVCAYYKGGELVGFYDYENFCGAVFN